MIKRVVIAGCRDYNNYDEAKVYIDFCISNIRKENDIIILSGCASGADALGERYAKENGWNIFGIFTDAVFVVFAGRYSYSRQFTFFHGCEN